MKDNRSSQATPLSQEDEIILDPENQRIKLSEHGSWYQIFRPENAPDEVGLPEEAAGFIHVRINFDTSISWWTKEVEEAATS